MAAAWGIGGRRAAIIATVTVLVAVSGLSLFSSTPVRGAVFTLYGSVAGWGFAPGSINSPGPTLLVTQGEMVHIDLYSADGRGHTWCIDYNRNNACELGENQSAQFASMTVALPHVFFVTGAPGTYHYVCGIHGGTTMWGVFQINPAPPPVSPVVGISAPTGGARWTGGTPHNIVWTMTDPDDPVTALRAWVNYSMGGPSAPIAGPIPGSTNPHSVTWTLPVVNTTSVSVNVTVADPAGNHGWAETPFFTIDSAAPFVASRTPANGSSGISTTTNVIVTFNESMNRSATATPATAALQDLSNLAWIPVTYGWSNVDAVLTMNPVPTLSPTTMYRASINASAKDASDPGNALSAPSVWSFTTAAAADLTKPQISNVVRTPAIAEYPTPVGVTATITDNVQVALAYVNLSRPDLSSLNFSMSIVSGSTWGRTQVYETAPPDYLKMIGSYTFRVEAVDASGNWNRSSPQSFTVRDTTPPAIANLAASPSPAEVYEAVNVTVAVSDPFLMTPSVVVNGTNASMNPGATPGTWYHRFVPMGVQTYAFVVWANDRRGNVNASSGSVSARDTKAPPMPTGLTATVIGGAVQLSWNPVSAFDLDGYRLNRSTSSSGPFTQVGSALVAGTAFTDRGVDPGVRYYYEVTAVDVRGHASMASGPVSVVVPPAAVDLTPILAGVAIGIVVAVLAVALLLRRRRAQPPKT